MTGDETEYLQPVVGLQPTQHFKPLGSSWAGSLLLFLVVSLVIVELLYSFSFVGLRYINRYKELVSIITIIVAAQ